MVTEKSEENLTLKENFECLTIFLLRAMWVIQISVILFENKDCYSTKKKSHV